MTEAEIITAMNEIRWPLYVRLNEDRMREDNRPALPPAWMKQAIDGGLVIAHQQKLGILYQPTVFAAKRMAR